MLKLTFDTSCFFDYFKRSPEFVERLIEFQDEGKVEIAMTTRVRADTIGKRANSSIWIKIKNFPCISIPTVGRWDISYWDEDFFGGEKESDLNDLIFFCIGKKIRNVRDVDHLIGHINGKRDIFVTRDESEFINNRVCLEGKCNVSIMTPEECVKHIEFKVS